VAAAADVLGIPVLATEDVNAAASVAALHARRPDLLVTVAFGQILGKEVLSLPSLGAVNLHFSLLPRWRGAAPVQRALEAGDGTTGVTLQRMAEKVDAGAILAQREVAVRPGERAGELEARLADVGAALLADLVAHAAETGVLIEGKPQDPAKVTVARKVLREEGRAEFAQSPHAFSWKVRAFHPWPLVMATLRAGADRPLLVALHAVQPARVAGLSEEPGSVLAAGRDGIEVACGGGSVLVTSLQRPGGKVLSAEAFLNGFPLRPGDRFS
jgi:methionyl-tRNA formyltransferase